MTDPFAEDLARKGLDAAPADPFAADLQRKGLGGLTPERKTQLEAKLAAGQARTAALKAGPSGNEPSDYIRSGIRGLATVGSDAADAATFGLYRKGRDKALAALDPETLKTIQGSEKEFHEAPGGAAMGVGGKVAGSMLGLSRLAGGIGAGITRGIGAGAPIVGGALGGAVAGGITAGAQATVEGDRPLDAAKQAGWGALGGGILGGAAGGIGKLIAGAPARQAESEIAGLREGVQTKTKIRKFVPNEDNIRAELARVPQLRTAIHADAVQALPAVKKQLGAVAESNLNPFYQRMAQSGSDQVPFEHVENQLKAAAGGFTKHAEGSQIAVVNHLIDGLREDAAQNGGRLPAQMLREEATAFQSQGHANVPMLGQIPLTKQVKQDIGNALRGAVADHLESLVPADAAGKLYRQSFVDANKRVATWYAIHDIVEENAKRTAAHAPTLMSRVKEIAHAVHNPMMAALPFAKPAAEAVNRNVLSPLAGSAAAGEVGRAAAEAAPSTGVNLLQRAALDKKKRDAEASRLLMGGQ